MFKCAEALRDMASMLAAVFLARCMIRGLHALRSALRQRCVIRSAVRMLVKACSILMCCNGHQHQHHRCTVPRATCGACAGDGQDHDTASDGTNTATINSTATSFTEFLRDSI